LISLRNIARIKIGHGGGALVLLLTQARCATPFLLPRLSGYASFFTCDENPTRLIEKCLASGAGALAPTLMIGHQWALAPEEMVYCIRSAGVCL